jgi:hypothetical protein
VIRGERLIKLRNIWFSTKTILVVRYLLKSGRGLIAKGGVKTLLIL